MMPKHPTKEVSSHNKAKKGKTKMKDMSKSKMKSKCKSMKKGSK